MTMLTWNEAMELACDGTRSIAECQMWIAYATELRKATPALVPVTLSLIDDSVLDRAQEAWEASERDRSGAVVPLQQYVDDGATTVIRTDPARAPRLRTPGDVPTEVIDTSGVWNCSQLGCGHSIMYDAEMKLWRHVVSQQNVCPDRDKRGYDGRTFAWPGERQGPQHWEGGDDA